MHELKDYRNQMTHNDIDGLAAGTIFQRLTPNQIRSSAEVDSTGETIIPESQDDKEIASDLAAEGKAGGLLIKVSQVLHDIFARHSTVNRTREPCE